MPTIPMVDVTERLSDTISKAVSTGGEVARGEPLPLALRADEISEQDAALLFHIAENPDAAGHLRRPARKIPAVKSTAE